MCVPWLIHVSHRERDRYDVYCIYVIHVKIICNLSHDRHICLKRDTHTYITYLSKETYTQHDKSRDRHTSRMILRYVSEWRGLRLHIVKTRMNVWGLPWKRVWYAIFSVCGCLSAAWQTYIIYDVGVYQWVTGTPFTHSERMNVWGLRVCRVTDIHRICFWGISRRLDTRHEGVRGWGYPNVHTRFHSV